MTSTKPEGASASVQRVKLRRTDDDAHQTLIVRGPPGFPLGAVHSATKPTGPKGQMGAQTEMKEFGKLAKVEK